MENCPGAHQAGLEGDIEAAAGEPVVSHRQCCGAQGLNLSMRRGVFITNGAVVSGSYDGVLPYHHSPHWYLIELCRLMRLLQGQAHEVLVGHGDLVTRKAPEHPEGTEHFYPDDDVDETHGLFGSLGSLGLNIYGCSRRNNIEEVDDILATHANAANRARLSHVHRGGAPVEINIAAHGIHCPEPVDARLHAA